MSAQSSLPLRPHINHPMRDTSLEEWRHIPGVNGYEASSFGRIRRTRPGRLTWSGRVIGCDVRGGYSTVGIGGQSVPAHPLVAAAFLGPRPHGHHINHKDGNKHNNRPENLEYVTPAENNRHAVRTGLNQLSGERNPSAKLVAGDVAVIRARYLRGASLDELARAFNVSKTQVCAIVCGRSWGLTDIRRPTLQRQIVVAVRDHGARTFADIAAYVEDAPNRRGGDVTGVLRTLVCRLVKNGELRRVRRGVFEPGDVDYAQGMPIARACRVTGKTAWSLEAQ